MRNTLALSKTYGSIFWGCTKFAVSPYTSTFLAIADTKNGNAKEKIAKMIAAGVICGVLTFVVPILPAVASITFALASVAMCLTVASMFLTYPIALLTDAISSLFKSNKTVEPKTTKSQLDGVNTLFKSQKAPEPKIRLEDDALIKIAQPC